MFNKRLIIVFLILISVKLAAQSSEGGAGTLIKPVYPEGSTGLIYLEAEDAVSTNFANQAVSNFGASGYRAVQLNRATGLQGGAAFYAEFVFYVEEAGEYEFWYGGTPPGPSDELSPSYASPFSMSLDGGEPLAVYREDVNVVEGYSPSYYWNKCISLNLEEGSHRLRIEVAEKRGFDGRYFFYIDSLFFLNREKLDEVAGVRPVVFPSVLEGSDIDNPFLSINDYQNYINTNPDDMSAYIELSLVYSLVGDYQSALKTLTKAMALDASDSYPIILAAKNRLWKGDVRESLDLYERALNVDPDNAVLWTEAGKVAAWSAEYERSIDFFKRGLEQFPDNLNMMVNLGLTYIWMARDADAEELFKTALLTAKGDPKRLSRLGWIEEAAGYPEYARDVYTESIKLYPAYLEFYLLLQSSYLSSGERESANEVGRLIESTFVPSARLQTELEIYQTKLNLRDEVIASYLDKLREDPGNLELRQELAQTFFWNGMSAEAIEQIKYVITTYSYRAAETFIRRNSELLAQVDLSSSLIPLLRAYPSYAAAAEKNITEAASILVKASKAEDKEALRAAGQNLADVISQARSLGKLMEDQSALVDVYEEKAGTILADEKGESEAFRSVIASSGWFWDRDWQSTELTDVMQDERELASFMLGRLLISEKKYDYAVEVLKPEAAGGESVEYNYSSVALPPLYSLYQSLLLSGDTGFDGSMRADIVSGELERLITDYPHITEVESRLALAADPLATAPAGIYYDGLAEESAELIDLLDKQSRASVELLKRTELLNKQLSAVMLNRLERTNYYLEADTYLIRFELGNYYLEEGNNKEAADQFRRVIAIDPWNISAAYKLGVVEQRYGNWSEAMKFYKKVYQQDSGYENAANYYNQLARLHGDKFVSRTQLIASPSEFTLAARMAYSMEFNSLIGLGISWNLDQRQQYPGFTDEYYEGFQMHLLKAEVPLSFGVSGLSASPYAGLYLENLFYKTVYVPPADRTVSLDSFLERISTFPLFGVSAGWSKDFLTLDVSWENAIVPETIYSERLMLRKNDFVLNANTWFTLDDIDFLGPLTTRTYGRLQFIRDDNIKGQVYQDVMLGFNLLSKPVIRLSPSASVNFETSKISPVEDYYAPLNVLEAKGGLRSAFTFPSSDWSRAFELVLWGAGGGYWSKLGVEDAGQSLVETSVKAEGGLGATWVKNGSQYYLNMNAVKTFPVNGDEYWELSAVLGTNLSLPGLLAP